MNARTQHARAVGLFLSAAQMRKRTFYRPLAVLMALFVVPVSSSAAGVSGSAPLPPPVEATQQLGGCVADPSSPSIIRQYCVNGTLYASDLIQLETDAVSMYLAERGLPASDANVVYDSGRKDLSFVVRWEMVLVV